MRRFLLAALLMAPASAQVLVPLADVPQIAGMLEPKPGEQTVRCSVDPAQPKLDYGFRFLSGYLLRIPLSQVSGTQVSGRVVLQVTPEGGAPAYLAAPVELQPAAGSKDPAVVAPGAFFLGQGSYTARLAFFDSTGRVCRGEWQVDARLSDGERSVKLALPAGGITDFPGAREATGQSSGVRIARRLTILLNANSPAAAIQLLETILALFPESEVRLVAFVTHGPPVTDASSTASPDAKQILQMDGVKIDDLDRIAPAIEPTQRWAVNYRELANQVDGWTLLAELLHRENGRAPKPDLILFLGPREAFPSKMPPHFLAAEPAARRRVFYLQRAVTPKWPQMPAGIAECREGSFWEPEPITHPGVRLYCPDNPRLAGFPDGIERAVERLKGQTLPFATPAEFAKAIDVIRKALAR